MRLGLKLTGGYWLTQCGFAKSTSTMPNETLQPRAWIVRFCLILAKSGLILNERCMNTRRATLSRRVPLKLN